MTKYRGPDRNPYSTNKQRSQGGESKDAYEIPEGREKKKPEETETKTKAITREKDGGKKKKWL